uniref:Secreted protein n=1 Tax=Knipowitschia caucasica TaxID=637954 RepID=A0AAV2KLS3_KNICA
MKALSTSWPSSLSLSPACSKPSFCCSISAPFQSQAVLRSLLLQLVSYLLSVSSTGVLQHTPKKTRRAATHAKENQACYNTHAKENQACYNTHAKENQACYNTHAKENQACYNTRQRKPGVLQHTPKKTRRDFEITIVRGHKTTPLLLGNF